MYPTVGYGYLGPISMTDLSLPLVIADYNLFAKAWTFISNLKGHAWFGLGFGQPVFVCS